MAKYAPHTSTSAVKRARSYVGKSTFSNMCQAFVVTIFGTGAVGDFDGDGAADAQDGWKKAKARGRVVPAKDIRSYDDIPAGVALYWEGGSRGYGHTAVSIGDGKMVSTDAGARWGIVGIRDIGYISRAWGNGLTFRGYVTTEGNGYTLTDPPKPTPKTVRWFEHRHLNTWGDDGGEGTSSLPQRLPTMVRDLTDGDPEVITLNEVREKTQGPLWVKAMGKAGYVAALLEAGNAVFVRKGIKVSYADSIYLAEGGGRREALGRVRIKVGGHWEHIGVTHLDYRDGAAYDAIRVRQGKGAIRAMRNLGIRRLLPDRSRWSIGLDENSRSWVRDKAFLPAGFIAAAKSGIDAIYTGSGRVVRSHRTISTRSDHPIVCATYGKKA